MAYHPQEETSVGHRKLDHGVPEEEVRWAEIPVCSQRPQQEMKDWAMRLVVQVDQQWRAPRVLHALSLSAWGLLWAQAEQQQPE